MATKEKKLPKAPVPDEATNTQKDPLNWKTGDEPMTGAQRSYLTTLAEEAGKEVDETLTKADASKMIDELRKKDKVVENRTSGAADASNTQKDPSHWKTGDEPMTGAQRSYLSTLAEEAGEELPDDLTKADASKKIDQLRHKSDRVEG